MSPYRSVLANTGILSYLRDVPAHIPMMAGWRGNTNPLGVPRMAHELVIVCGGWSIELGMRHRSHLAETARLAGGQLARTDPSGRAIPRIVYLVMAWIGHHGQVPEAIMLQSLVRLLESTVPDIPVHAMPAPASHADLRVRVGVLIHATDVSAADRDLRSIHRWDAARMMIGMGIALWQITGVHAARWGQHVIDPHSIWTMPGDSETLQHYRWMCGLAIVCTPTQGYPVYIPESLPLFIALRAYWQCAAADGIPQAALLQDGASMLQVHPVAPDIVETYLRRMCNISDPAPFALDDSSAASISAGTLFATIAQDMAQHAARILQDVYQPPRMLGRIIRVVLPISLLPLLAVTGITALRMQVTRTGLLSVLEMGTTDYALFWWSANAGQAWRCPITMPIVYWPLIHLVCAGLWRDLCADVIVRDDMPPPVPRPDTHTGHVRTASVLTLPPTRRAGIQTTGNPRVLPSVTPVTWIDATDAIVLERVRTAGGRYRRLPYGWEAHDAVADRQRRRTAAAARAAEEGYPAPLSGYTYVRTHERRVRGSTDAPARPVRARGMLAVVLAISTRLQTPES